MQAEDVSASFLLVGDFDWWSPVGYTTTNCHLVAAFDFATVSSCNWLVVGPTIMLALSIHVVEHLTSWLSMFLTTSRLLLWHQWVTQITPLCWQSYWWLRLFQTYVWVGKFSWNIVSTRILSVVSSPSLKGTVLVDFLNYVFMQLCIEQLLYWIKL